jgi:hypothetical protein
MADQPRYSGECSVVRLTRGIKKNVNLRGDSWGNTGTIIVWPEMYLGYFSK